MKLSTGPTLALFAIAALTTITHATSSLCSYGTPAPTPGMTPITVEPTPAPTTSELITPAPTTSEPITPAPPRTHKISFESTQRVKMRVDFTENTCVSIAYCLATDVSSVVWDDIGRGNSVTFFIDQGCRSPIVTVPAADSFVRFGTSDDMPPPLAFAIGGRDDLVQQCPGRETPSPEIE